MNDEEIDLDVLQEEDPLPTLNENTIERPDASLGDEDLQSTAVVVADRRSSINDRLHKLKLKMNQAKQLNLKEVASEGERLGSEEGILRYKKDVQRQEKDRKIKDKQNIHAKLIRGNASAWKEEDVDSKVLTQTAAESIHKAHHKAEKAAMDRFSVRDYHNPEGQFRNYDKHVRSMQRNDTGESNTTTPSNSYYIMEHEVTAAYQKERQGASRLATALHQRAEKTLKKRKKSVKDMVANDVNHINKRNMLYNQKIARNYDAHTAEIRQNLERGTAL
jgi:pre-mRNA-splicing factor SYF2